MSRRFYNVLRGYRGQAARDTFLRHLQGLGTQGTGIGTRGGRPATQPVYIVPFALPLGTDTYVQASALEAAVTTFDGNSQWSSRTKKQSELDTNAVSIKLKQYKPPRVVRRSVSATGAPETSHLTGLKYLKYTTHSQSAPFGKGASDTSKGPFTVYQEIVTAFGASTGIHYSYIDEKA